MLKVSALVCVCVGLLFLVLPASANLISNGSFESGPAILSSPWYVGLCPPTSIGTWTVMRGQVDFCSTNLWDCADGVRSVDLNGSNNGCSTPGGVSQRCATIPNAAYKVSFWLAGNYGGGPTVKNLRVTAAGQQADFTFDVSGHGPRSMGWTYHEWVFTAAADSTTLELYSLDSGYWGPVIDEVAVDLVGTASVAPEPFHALWLDTVRPNPTRGAAVVVSFTLPSPAPASLELCDVTGRRIATYELGSLGAGRHTQDISEARRLSPGLYLVRLRQGASTRVTRVVVLD
jgi:choice-of-anchor C domain-containing protein